MVVYNHDVYKASQRCLLPGAALHQGEVAPCKPASQADAEAGDDRGTESHGWGFGGVPRLFLPPLRPAAGEGRNSGCRGRSPMAGGSGVSPVSISPFAARCRRGQKQGVPGDGVPWLGVRGCPPFQSPLFAARRRRGQKQGVPGDGVPWPGVRGCPPPLSPPFAGPPRRAAGVPGQQFLIFT